MRRLHARPDKCTGVPVIYIQLLFTIAAPRRLSSPWSALKAGAQLAFEKGVIVDGFENGGPKIGVTMGRTNVYYCICDRGKTGS